MRARRLEFCVRWIAPMSRTSPLQHCRRPALRAWVAPLLVVLLLLAEAFAVTHPYDSAAHSNGQSCAECLSVATFSAGAVAAPLALHLPAPVPLFVTAVAVVLFSTVPTRRYARGPPTVSFTR